jgi:hypothetical protein
VLVRSIPLLIALAIPRAAHAQQQTDGEEPSPVARDPAHAGEISRPRIALAGHLSLGSPFGNAGVEVELAPLPWLSFAVGGGLGQIVPNRDVEFGEYTVAAMARARIDRDIRGQHWTLVVGVGPSQSNWRAYQYGFSGWLDRGPLLVAERWDSVWYANAELGAERHWGRVSLRLYVGAALLVSAGDYSCRTEISNGCGDPSAAPGSNVFIGSAMAYAFPL